MLAEQFDVFLFDLDGVIYLGYKPLPGSVESLARLRGMGKTIRFLTNNPRKTRSEIADGLAGIGIEAHLEEVITSGWATAKYLHENKLGSAYVVGNQSLRSEIRSLGIEIIDQGNCEAVVVGHDEQVSYEHIHHATRLIYQGSIFIATNVDATFPMPEGPWPGTGSVVIAVQVATGRVPIIMGKPYPPMFRIALEGLASGSQFVMVGDNPASDILGAHRMGITAILISSKTEHFPSSRDFRRADIAIPWLPDLFDDRLSAHPYEKPDFLWPDRVEAGVAAVILDRSGRVLLVKERDGGPWGLPSSHVEPGETVEEAIRRGVREETELEVGVTGLIGVYSNPVSQVFSNPSGEISQRVTCCFSGEVISGNLQPGKADGFHAAFFEVDKLPTHILPTYSQYLSDALARRESAFIR